MKRFSRIISRVLATASALGLAGLLALTVGTGPANADADAYLKCKASAMEHGLNDLQAHLHCAHLLNI